jgi:hypothetical protein
VTMPDTRYFVWAPERGERERLTVPIYEADGLAERDVTGYTVLAEILTAPGGTVLYTFPVEQITITGASVELLVPAPVSTAWTFTAGWWRLAVTPPDADPLDPDTQFVVHGPFFVRPT